MRQPHLQTLATMLVFLCLVAGVVPIVVGEPVIVGGTGKDCLEDPGCVNRLHPDIPMTARAQPGEPILFRTRDADDALGAIAAQTDEPKAPSGEFGRVHPVTGPVFIEGAVAGDVLKVTITQITPGKYGWTNGYSNWVAPDIGNGESLVMWRLGPDYAESEDLPGIRIPNASFPGIVTTLPGKNELRRMLAREQALAEAGGSVSLPMAEYASPAELCGRGGTASDDCLRTIPPREHGGNMDIRHLGVGVSIYLPCFIDGCGLAIGDLHYAQGDGEVAGTAIEMSADVWVTTEVMESGPDLTRGPHYEGLAHLLSIPSGRFYAVTGLPLKVAGEPPAGHDYMDSGVGSGLENLSNDMNLAARNALDGIVDYIVATYGYSRQQAILIASVAVDLRIAQLVDAPNVGITAILPLDIFVGH